MEVIPYKENLLVSAIRGLALVALRLFTRLEVNGMEKFPMAGPVLMVMNHLHWMDVVVALAILPRPAVVFAADKWERVFLIGQILRWSKRTIFVARGEADRKALRAALDVLKADGVLGIAPEGTRSKTGGLQKGHTGAAYLASRTGAAILPMGLAGQESALRMLFRLRRARIQVNIGDPFVLPDTSKQAKGIQLEVYTDDIMHRVAAQLPPQYRGVYAIDTR